MKKREKSEKTWNKQGKQDDATPKKGGQRKTEFRRENEHRNF